jgi:hypothetical protein
MPREAPVSSITGRSPGFVSGRVIGGMGMGFPLRTGAELGWRMHARTAPACIEPEAIQQARQG